MWTIIEQLLNKEKFNSTKTTFQKELVNVTSIDSLVTKNKWEYMEFIFLCKTSYSFILFVYLDNFPFNISLFKPNFSKYEKSET